MGDMKTLEQLQMASSFVQSKTSGFFLTAYGCTADDQRIFPVIFPHLPIWGPNQIVATRLPQLRQNGLHLRQDTKTPGSETSETMAKQNIWKTAMPILDTPKK